MYTGNIKILTLGFEPHNGCAYIKHINYNGSNYVLVVSETTKIKLTFSFHRQGLSSGDYIANGINLRKLKALLKILFT